MTNHERTTCLVVGGGPAGMILGLLMARAGVETTVLEKHADFLRDFRGDTVHASTLTLLDELGLGERFAAIPHRELVRMQAQLDAGWISVADMTRLPGRHKHIAMAPQWDLLDMLADAAAAEPTFTLRRNAEVVGLLREGDRVVGVRWRDRVDGSEHEHRATLTVGCDGRHSAVREALGRSPRAIGVPVDIWWFRVPRHADDPGGGVGRFSSGQFSALIDRGDYWQCAYGIRKGTDAALRAEGIDAFRRRYVGLIPWLGDRMSAVTSFDEVKLLDIRLERLPRWDGDGVLLIGDAAHAMSPVGGVGINLAVADAVATARILAPALRRGRPLSRSLLRRVERRRRIPTMILQGIQKAAHRAVLTVPEAVAEVHDGSAGPRVATLGELADAASRAPLESLPLPLRLLQQFPVLQGIPARLMAIGPLPEHAPAWARRPPQPVPATRSGTAGE